MNSCTNLCKTPEQNPGRIFGRIPGGIPRQIPERIPGRIRGGFPSQIPEP